MDRYIPTMSYIYIYDGTLPAKDVYSSFSASLCVVVFVQAMKLINFLLLPFFLSLGGPVFYCGAWSAVITVDPIYLWITESLLMSAYHPGMPPTDIPEQSVTVCPGDGVLPSFLHVNIEAYL